MKTKIVLYFVCFLAVLCTVGCDEEKDSTTTPNPSGFTFGVPKIGDRADYRMISGPDTNSFYTEVLQKFGTSVYLVRQTINWRFSGTEIDTQYMSVTSDEWKEVEGPAAALSGMRLFSAMEVNKAYTYQIMPWSRWGSKDTISYTLLSKTEQITVPAGTFSCLKVRMKGIGSSQVPETDIYISPGNGQVKIVNAYSLVEMTGKNY